MTDTKAHVGFLRHEGSRARSARVNATASRLDQAADDLIACADREIKQRDAVYPRLIDAKKMSREKANRERKLMNAVRSVLLTLKDQGADLASLLPKEPSHAD